MAISAADDFCADIEFQRLQRLAPTHQRQPAAVAVQGVLDRYRREVAAAGNLRGGERQDLLQALADIDLTEPVGSDELYIWSHLLDRLMDTQIRPYRTPDTDRPLVPVEKFGLTRVPRHASGQWNYPQAFFRQFAPVYHPASGGDLYRFWRHSPVMMLQPDAPLRSVMPALAEHVVQGWSGRGVVQNGVLRFPEIDGITEEPWLVCWNDRIYVVAGHHRIVAARQGGKVTSARLQDLTEHAQTLPSQPLPTDRYYLLDHLILTGHRDDQPDLHEQHFVARDGLLETGVVQHYHDWLHLTGRVSHRHD